jgi:hypothetical protein
VEPLTIIVPFSGGEGLEVTLDNDYGPGMKALRMKGEDDDLARLALFIRELLDDASSTSLG